MYGSPDFLYQRICGLFIIFGVSFEIINDVADCHEIRKRSIVKFDIESFLAKHDQVGKLK